MAASNTSRADLEAERNDLWARLAGVNAELEAPVTDEECLREALSRCFGRTLTMDEATGFFRDAGMVGAGFNFLMEAYRRLYRVSAPVMDGLHKQCDHVTYEGAFDEVADLEAEMAAAEAAMGAFLASDDNEREEVDHG